MEYINEFKYENNPITIINDNDNNIWFNIYQFSIIFDYKNPKQIIKELLNTKYIKFFKNIVKNYKLYPKIHQQVLFIHQTELFTLIVESKKPYAEKKKILIWITQDVIPSISCKKIDTILTIEDVIPSIGYKKRNTINIIVFFTLFKFYGCSLYVSFCI
jgi:prophage antirepressor-like protein